MPIRTAQAIVLGFAVAGLAWPAWFEYLRHRSWLRHRNSPLVPGTQGLALVGAAGGVLWLLVAVAVLVWDHYAR